MPCAVACPQLCPAVGFTCRPKSEGSQADVIVVAQCMRSSFLGNAAGRAEEFVRIHSEQSEQSPSPLPVCVFVSTVSPHCRPFQQQGTFKQGSCPSHSCPQGQMTIFMIGPSCMGAVCLSVCLSQGVAWFHYPAGTPPRSTTYGKVLEEKTTFGLVLLLT